MMAAATAQAQFRKLILKQPTTMKFYMYPTIMYPTTCQCAVMCK